jgi:cytochrome P450
MTQYIYGAAVDPPTGRPGQDTELAARFELHDPAIQEDPYPLYRRLREGCPVAWSEKHGGHWVITSHEVASTVFQDPDTFSNVQALIPNWEFPLGRQIPVEIDGEPHRLYRLALSSLFNPRMVNGIEPLMRASARRWALEFRQRGHGDLVADYIVGVTSETFLHTFDLPVEVLPDMLEFKDLLIHGGSAGRDGLKAGEEAIVAFFRQVLDTRRAAGAAGDDVMSHLLRAKYDDRPLTDEEIVNIAVVLMLASLDTTTATMSNAFGYLAEHPGRRQVLVDDPGLVPNAVEEFLRYEGVTGTTRTATRDTELHGQQVRAGDKVMMVIGATGRDADTYSDPEEVDFGRQGIRHLTFGIGPHRCLGMHLARRTMTVGIQEFHAVIPDYAVTPGERAERVVGHVRSVRRLPLTVVPA